MSMLDKILPRYAQCDRVRADHWRLALSNGSPLAASARCDGGFFLLDADTGISPTATNVFSLAVRSGRLPATLKLAALRGSPVLRLRAEFPLPEESEIPEDRIRGYLEGMQLGMHRLHDEFSREAVGEEMACPSPRDAGQAIAGSLAELLKEAGWPYRERPGGRLLADLETGNHFLQAEIENHGAGARFRVTLYRKETAGECAQQALCFYLLEANAALRYVRAFLERENQEISTGFEVLVETIPSAAEVGHALSALTVAARQCAAELKVLDGAVAGIYRSTRPPFYRSKGA